MRYTCGWCGVLPPMGAEENDAQLLTSPEMFRAYDELSHGVKCTCSLKNDGRGWRRFKTGKEETRRAWKKSALDTGVGASFWSTMRAMATAFFHCMPERAIGGIDLPRTKLNWLRW